jgi:predicted transcriptional regulator
MSKKTVNLHISSLEDMGRRFVGAWKDAEAGRGRASRHTTFLGLESFTAALSPKRLALLRRLRAEGPSSVRALSVLLERDYKSVHRDVDTLIAAGLIAREARDRVSVTWDRVVAEMDLAAA